jgi:hypothetical protein
MSGWTPEELEILSRPALTDKQRKVADEFIAWMRSTHTFTPCNEDHNFTCALLCTVCGKPEDRHLHP